jgi:SIT family siderophore-iron:H+ symporter-like MFS transporter
MCCFVVKYRLVYSGRLSLFHLESRFQSVRFPTSSEQLKLTGRPVKEATWIQNIYSFVSVITGVVVGVIVRYVRRLKYFAVAGTLLFVLAFGLLYRYRGGTETHQLAGLVGAEVVLGVAGGLFPYPTQALIQAAVQHERTAIVTALYLASYSIGSALGNTIAGGIWINTLPNHILDRFNEIGIADAQELATLVYGDPIKFIDENPRGAVGQPERIALMTAYGEVQRYLTITGLCLSALLVIASLCLKNPRLGDQQSFQDAEGFEVSSVDSREIKHAGDVGPGAEPEDGRYTLGNEENRVGVDHEKTQRVSV